MKKFNLIQLAEDRFEHDLGIHAYQDIDDGRLYVQVDNKVDLRVTDHDILYHAVRRLEELSSTDEVVLIGDMTFQDDDGEFGLYDVRHVYDTNKDADEIAEIVTKNDKKSSGWITSTGLLLQLNSKSHIAGHLIHDKTEFIVDQYFSQPKKVFRIYAEQTFYVGHNLDIEASTEEEAKRIAKDRIIGADSTSNLEYATSGNNADEYGITIFQIDEVE